MGRLLALPLGFTAAAVPTYQLVAIGRECARAGDCDPFGRAFAMATLALAAVGLVGIAVGRSGVAAAVGAGLIVAGIAFAANAGAVGVGAGLLLLAAGLLGASPTMRPRAEPTSR